jgi:hypothetical protein
MVAEDRGLHLITLLAKPIEDSGCGCDVKPHSQPARIDLFGIGRRQHLRRVIVRRDDWTMHESGHNAGSRPL